MMKVAKRRIIDKKKREYLEKIKWMIRYYGRENIKYEIENGDMYNR